MVLRLRLARFGRKSRPFYRIHATDARNKRDGKFLESVGTYNPIPYEKYKFVRLDTDRIKYWLSVGAKPSKRVAFLLSKFNLLPEQPLANDFTYKKPPSFREIPSWWKISSQEIDAYYKEEGYQPTNNK